MTPVTRSMDVRERVAAEFSMRFGASPDVMVRAPGRVNLIGEHTDYNDGFVLPVAIDRELWIALRARADCRVHLHSIDLGSAEFPLNELVRGDGGWSEYVKGVAWALREAGCRLVGWEGVLGSDVPIGAGLSSSAALEMATLRAFTSLVDRPWKPEEAARIGQRVENEWIGVNSGIMDQLAIAAGQRNHALLIDCRSLSVAPVPLPGNVSLVVLDTATRRGLVDSAYNERRRQCEIAAAHFGVAALRDVNRALLNAAAGTMDPVVYRRARHVVTENERTLEAAHALRSADLGRLGQLMNESHASLRDDFEVSTEALDAMAGFARDHAGCIGARMTGAGFGGCVIALVDDGVARTFANRVTADYHAALGITPHAWICTGADGASVIELRRTDRDQALTA